MEIGKIPNELLKKYILDNIKHNRKEILIHPGIGEDCCAIDFDKYACVLSSDPITGAVNDIGRLAVNISCNDIASSGVEPLALLATVLCPPETTLEQIEFIMNDMVNAAGEINVEIAGGHTEITSAVNKIVIITTACGKIIKEKLVTSSKAKAGDKLIVTKAIGLEGTSIIAKDLRAELERNIDKSLLDNASSFINEISVVKEGVLAASVGVNAMHDITEGGVYGAVWEVCEASGLGAAIYEEAIPVRNETSQICKLLDINPYRLISSGSMLIATDVPEAVTDILAKNNIASSVIGEMTDSKDRIIYINGEKHMLDSPGTDELYKVV